MILCLETSEAFVQYIQIKQGGLFYYVLILSFLLLRLWRNSEKIIRHRYIMAINDLCPLNIFYTIYKSYIKDEKTASISVWKW